MKKAERIYLTDLDGIDLFEPERGSSARVVAESAVPDPPLEMFSPERFSYPQRSPVPSKPHSRLHLVAIAGLAASVAVLGLVISDPSIVSVSLPVMPSRPPVLASNNATLPTPPVDVDVPVASEPAVTEPPRLPRPLSQDPGRLAAGVPTSPTPRASVDVQPPAPPPEVTPPPAAAEPPRAAPPAAVAAPASPPAVSPPAVSRPAAASVIDVNRSGIQSALAKYQQAFSSLDAHAARQIWPTVNERTLSRAFERLEMQEVSLEACQIEVNEDRGEAQCNGTARYVPRVGNRSARVDRRQWKFDLVKKGDEWLIGAVEAR